MDFEVIQWIHATASILFLNHPNLIGTYEMLIEQTGLLSSKNKLPICNMSGEETDKLAYHVRVYAMVKFIDCNSFVLLHGNVECLHKWQ